MSGCTVDCGAPRSVISRRSSGSEEPLPSSRMVQGLERLGFPQEFVDYYAEHVEADAVHEQHSCTT